MEEKDEYCAHLDVNTYIQHKGGMIGRIGGNENGEPEVQIFDKNAETNLNSVFGDEKANVYIIE